MPNPVIEFVILAFVWRIASVVVSTRNEIALKKAGGREVGAANSIVLALAHLAYYVIATAEGCWNPAFNWVVAAIGVVIYIVAAIALVSVVTTLGPLWTVKIIINRRHPFVRKGLFAYFRHPNYFVSIVPELVGFALAVNAYWTLILGLPLYLIPLSIRIRQEEAAMVEAVPGYK
jgi:isoprenylcysteine carboxyl methyltransferase (ICMT) family protein YpbQ